nr:hypothetical protein [Tanacetum cinerariifolium]
VLIGIERGDNFGPSTSLVPQLGLDFTDVPDDDIALTFLIDLGYKGPLYKHANMFVDHMHQPWRTLAAIIKNCLSGKTARNDKLKKSRIDILCSSSILLVRFPPSRAKAKVYKERRLLMTLKKLFMYLKKLAKSIRQTKAEEAEAARKIYATHARIVTESILESSKKSGGRRFKKEQEAVDIMQSLKENKKTSRRQPWVLDEEKDITEENVILEWGDEQDSEHSDYDNDDVDKDDKDGDADDEGDDHISDAQDADDEDVKTESDEEDIYKYKILQHTTTSIPTPLITTDAQTVTKVVLESNALTAVELRVAKLEKDMSELKIVDHYTEALAILNSQVASVVDNYLGSKVGDNSTNPCMQTHLDGSVIVDFIVALRMFTRSLILKRRVEDLQLGVESYQTKLNIIKPQKTFPEIEFKESYTPSYDPSGILYEDLNKQKRVLLADELYKFSDGTLKSVRDEIHQEYSTFVWITTLRCQRESGRLLTERDRVL